MRVGPLRETSDRGRKLFEFQVKPATDRVDHEHVPDHILPLFENAINEQQRVTYLNLYLQVTGRQPRSATELGWNATREEPTLLENDEVGYGYALAIQHQHHCANILADAIDLGRDNINDFFLVHIVHCISLLKIYAKHLSEYCEPVWTLTDWLEVVLSAALAWRTGRMRTAKLSVRSPCLCICHEYLWLACLTKSSECCTETQRSAHLFESSKNRKDAVERHSGQQDSVLGLLCS